MKFNKLINHIFFLALFLALISCNKESNCNADLNLTLALNDAEDRWIDAEVDYLFNATEENCNSYKSALLNYIDEAEKLMDCAKQTGKEDELQELMDEANDELEDLPC